jgi:serine/threonine protein kinase/tetratricopeptide (TPR) repeat protein
MSETGAPESCSVESILSQAADEFMSRLERGETLDVEDYARRYPQVSTILRQVLPALASLRSPLRRPAALNDPVPAAPFVGCLGDFRILREVGRGGMGIVYEAEQISLGRRVALKVLPLAPAMDAKQLQRFKNEAQASAHLHHSHIVPVYAVGCDRGVHYYAMQFIEGHTLADMIADLEPQAYWNGPVSRPDRNRTTQYVRRASQEASKSYSPRADRNGCPTALPRTGGTDRNGCPPGGQPLSQAVERNVSPPTAPRSPAIARVPVQAAVETPPARPATVSSRRTLKNTEYFRLVAELGVQTAEALEYAHQMGVVHRDIKPANLMVDVQGHLWITDFGLARCHQGDGGLTMSGDLVGTLRYMSPEQALAKRFLVDHRTDIYSLGVTLYELLALQPAYSGRDREELLRKIAFEEPRRPRCVNASIPVELETIVLKAMAKEPEGRYATAQDLADDLHCFLEHKPIRARRPSLLECSRKWARRHRSAVWAAIVMLMLTLAGTNLSLFFILREQTNTKEALANVERQRILADTQRVRAANNFRMFRNVVIRFLHQLEEKRWASLPKHALLRLALAEELVHCVQDYADKACCDPDTKFDAGMAYMIIGNVYRVQGIADKATPQFEKAITLFDKLVEQFPEEPLYQGELAMAHFALGIFLDELGCAVKATEHHQDAAEHFKLAVQRNPTCRILNNYAWFLVSCQQTDFRDPEKAVSLALRAVAIAPQWGECRNTLGAAYYRAGKLDEAITTLNESMRLRGGGDAFDWYFLAMAYWQKGDKKNAQDLYRRATREVEKTNIFLEPLRPFQREAAALLGIQDEAKHDNKKTGRRGYSSSALKHRPASKRQPAAQVAQNENPACLCTLVEVLFRPVPVYTWFPNLSCKEWGCPRVCPDSGSCKPPG